MSTTVSSYVWWLIFTVVVLVTWSMTMALDGFFVVTKSKESFVVGVETCIGDAAEALGYGVGEAYPYDVGMPKLKYLKSTRPDVLEAYFTGAQVDQIFGSACKYCGPIQPTETCKAILEKMDTTTPHENEIETSICLASTYAVASTCVTHPKLRIGVDGTKYYGYNGVNSTVTFGNQTLEEHRSNGWIPCEHRTREACASSATASIDSVSDGDPDEEVSECMESFHDNTGNENFVLASPNYLVDKLGTDVDTAICRYTGDNQTSCKNYYTLMMTDGRPGIEYIAQVENPSQSYPESVWTQERSTYAKPFRADEFMIQSNDAIDGEYDLAKEDLDLMAAFSAEFILLSELKLGKAEIYDTLSEKCFAASLHDKTLLYTTVTGALYLSFGILLVVAHLAWLGAAWVDNHTLRFNSKRLMGLFGVTLSMLGLYVLFFVYGSSAGDIYNDDEARKLGSDIAFAGHGHLSRIPFLNRLEHGSMLMHNDGYTSTGTIQALEILHFIMLALAVGVPMFHPDPKAENGQVTWLA